MIQETRALELRALLTACRTRLRPEDVGLPATVRRRVPGLRREEVAELVGVSANWYALFENGSQSRRFSPAFVQRVADALRLDERERAQLFRLALPDIRLAVEQFERSAHDGALRNLRGIRSLVHRVTAAASFAEAVEMSVATVQEVIAPSSVSVAILVPGLDAPRPEGVRGGRAVRGLRHVFGRQLSEPPRLHDVQRESFGVSGDAKWCVRFSAAYQWGAFFRCRRDPELAVRT